MSELVMDVVGGVARIKINRPEVMNAMRAEMWPQLGDLVRELEHNRDVRCVLLTGEGKHFCAGGDVMEFASTVDLTPDERATRWMRSADRTNALLFTVLERIPQPFVVSVRGVAAGGGLSLVAAADLAIASENARFHAAQVKLGAIPDSCAAYNFVRHFGIKRAKQYGFLGETMDAETALELGFVNWVVPDAKLEARTEELVCRLVKIPRAAISGTKALMNAAHRQTIAEYSVQEAIEVGVCVKEEDFVRNVRSFVNKATKSKG